MIKCLIIKESSMLFKKLSFTNQIRRDKLSNYFYFICFYYNINIIIYTASFFSISFYLLSFDINEEAKLLDQVILLFTWINWINLIYIQLIWIIIVLLINMIG